MNQYAAVWGSSWCEQRPLCGCCLGNATIVLLHAQKLMATVVQQSPIMADVAFGVGLPA